MGIFLVTLFEIYSTLLQQYGPQGWWPLLSLEHFNQNPTKRGRFTGYHPLDYRFPFTKAHQFEIILGSILTQNTSWINAEKALINLKDAHILSISALRVQPIEILADLIRPSGYFNQKAQRIKDMVSFLTSHPLASLNTIPTEKIRDMFLNVRGIGEETADSIVLYAFHRPVFIVDAYTRRFLSRFNYISGSASYYEIQQYIVSQLPREERLFNEYHALIVHHCVQTCLVVPKCTICCFQTTCPRIIIPEKLKKKAVKKKDSPQSS